MKIVALLLMPALLAALPLRSQESAPVRAAEAGVPDVVEKGFGLYLQSGTLAAIDAWLAGSTHDSDDRYQDAAAARMERAQAIFGHPIGYEAIRSVVISPSTRRVYMVLKFERGVAWMYFDCYRPDKQWVVTRFDLQTDASLILPANILSGSGK